MAQNDFTIHAQYNDSMLHSALENPLQTEGVYYRRLRWNYAGSAMVITKTGLSGFDGTSALSLRAWFRVDYNNMNGQSLYLSIKGSNGNANDGYRFGLWGYSSGQAVYPITTFHGSTGIHWSQPLPNNGKIWKHLRMDVIPILHNGAVIMDHVKCYFGDGATENETWTLFEERYIEASDSGFITWNNSTYKFCKIVAQRDAQYWSEVMVDKVQLFVENVEQPVALSLALTTDTGASNDDKITSNDDITVTGLENGATAHYSLDNSSWQQSMPAFSEGVNTLYAKQISAEGRSSNVSTLEFTLVTTPPAFSSGGSASIIENSGDNQVVYTAEATSIVDIIYSLKPVDDHAEFSINSTTGVVTLLADPDYEAKSSYLFTVVAQDLAGNAAEQQVTLSVVDLGE